MYLKHLPLAHKRSRSVLPVRVKEALHFCVGHWILPEPLLDVRLRGERDVIVACLLDRSVIKKLVCGGPL